MTTQESPPSAEPQQPPTLRESVTAALELGQQTFGSAYSAWQPTDALREQAEVIGEGVMQEFEEFNEASKALGVVNMLASISSNLAALALAVMHSNEIATAEFQIHKAQLQMQTAVFEASQGPQRPTGLAVAEAVPPSFNRAARRQR